MSEHTPEVGPIVKVARDLSAIIEMAPQLDDQAEAKANATMDGRSLPGGLAMVALAPVANIEAWEHQYETAERMGRDTTWIEDEDATWEPPLMTLRFWSDAWRAEHDADYGQRPTVHSEASFIKASLNWAWDHEPAFDDFAKDIRRARVRLENVLYAGVRVERTRIECDQCDESKRLIKVYGEATDGADDWWKCPGCNHRHDDDSVRKAHAKMLRRNEAAKFVDQADALATLKSQGRPNRTVRKWLNPIVPLDKCEVCDETWPHQEHATCPSKADGEECGGMLTLVYVGDPEAVVEAYCDLGTRRRLVWWPDLWRRHLMTQTRTRKAASGE